LLRKWLAQSGAVINRDFVKLFLDRNRAEWCATLALWKIVFFYGLGAEGAIAWLIGIFDRDGADRTIERSRCAISCIGTIEWHGADRMDRAIVIFCGQAIGMHLVDVRSIRGVAALGGTLA
jgi:hypothetical protein